MCHNQFSNLLAILFANVLNVLVAGGDALQVQDSRGSRRVPGDRPQRARPDRGAGGPGHHVTLPRQHGHVRRVTNHRPVSGSRDLC